MTGVSRARPSSVTWRLPVDTAWAWLLVLVLGIPLLMASWSAVAAGLHADAWRQLLQASQAWPGIGLSVWTGLAASLLSLGLAAWILSRSFPSPLWSQVVRLLGPMLAVPHAAFGIGLVFLIAPSGWLLRLVSPWATGMEAPPPWVTSQDPWGIGLIVVLVAKEVPFLLWAAASQLQRADVAWRLTRELDLARSLGYAPHTAWWRVVWPQLWPRLRWPMLAVLAYAMTVVDVALVAGPASPPTLAVLAWTWLRDADPVVNQQGAAAAWMLAIMLALSVALLALVPRLGFWRTRRTRGTRGHSRTGPRGTAGRAVVGALLLLYLVVMLVLATGSIAGVWPFPKLLPETLTWAAWSSVWASAGTLGTTLSLGLASASCALLWSVAWLETAPPRWDEAVRRLVYLPLVLPPVLWVVGIHATTLRWGIDARWSGVWLAHTLACVPYVLITLGPAYGGFDPRMRQVAASLGHGRAVFLLRIKWPLLRASLASAWAVGLAVSVAQYLPTLFIGAGRYATVTTEAVTLASGAQRSLTSAYAWLQWLLPVAGFALAAWLGKPRRFSR